MADDRVAQRRVAPAGFRKVSRFLSLVLRHQPQRIGLQLDAQGWAEIEVLIARAGAHGMALTREIVLEVVATSDKRRFALDASGQRIRANQGHSIDIDLGLEPREPPEVLFHGTAETNLAAIRVEGLKPGRRQHVHLSTTLPPPQPLAAAMADRSCWRSQRAACGPPASRSSSPRTACG